MHSFNNISRSDVFNIKSYVEVYILNPVLDLMEECLNQDNLIETPISNIVKDMKLLFENVKTDFRLQKNLSDKGLISSVETFKINNDPKSNATIMPLEFQFKNIFERNNYLDDVLRHMETIESSGKFTNFIQGELWKEKKLLYPNKTLIPFFLYNDDFGINNPLGAKSNKNSICNFYYSFPCVPTKSSKLNEVFLACTYNSSDIKRYGNDCFAPLVETLKKLEIEEFNDRLSSFRYESHDKGSEKLNVSYPELENHKLKMSAKQMMAFCFYFTILIGDFIPKDDQVWEFLLNFFELLDDLLCFQISDPLINQVRKRKKRYK
ncbi:hypothetical protein FF38_10210 [Lucilia cuprina]|uniref:Uncharacterized protein n=1 Tax=Lucilia cuprina TaxID=7375 RepID=A0A0L0C5W2_LUCCU|nr:hypothetical protein FF38_10210 [Lucilia cuprina]